MSAVIAPIRAPVTERVDAILRDWLADPGITLICGRWHDGGIMELMPEGRARLSPPRYEGEFAGLRDLDIDGQPHHMHLDLAKLSRVVYLVAPSVCYGFRPSFELRLCTDDAGATSIFGLGIGLRHPYRAGRIAADAVRRYLRRLVTHRTANPDLVGIRALDAPVPEAAAKRKPEDWAQVGRCIEAEFGMGTSVHDAPSFVDAVQRIALAPA